MSEERDKIIFKGLIALLDEEAEIIKEAIKDDDHKKVIDYEERLEYIEKLIGNYFNATEEVTLFYKRHEEVEKDISNYFIERSKRLQAQRAAQEA